MREVQRWTGPQSPSCRGRVQQCVMEERSVYVCLCAIKTERWSTNRGGEHSLFKMQISHLQA